MPIILELCCGTAVEHSNASRHGGKGACCGEESDQEASPNTDPSAANTDPCGESTDCHQIKIDVKRVSNSGLMAAKPLLNRLSVIIALLASTPPAERLFSLWVDREIALTSYSPPIYTKNCVYLI